MRKFFIFTIFILLLIPIGTPSFAKNIDYIVEIIDRTDICIVSVIFTVKVSPETAEEIVSSIMKFYIPFRKDRDIIGTAWYRPNGTTDPLKEESLNFPSNTFLVIRKGNDKVIPLK